MDIIKAIEDEYKNEQVHNFNIGDTVDVHVKIKEGNRERIQVFTGTVIKRQNSGLNETFTVRKISSGIGVDTVRVSAKIKEGNRERTQVFEGTVLKKQGTGVRATFTVRKISNGVGVEKTWPLHSPIVEKVDVVRRGKVRRAKLYYLRDRVGKAAKTKEATKQ